jgi:hypothetical protein
MPVGTLGSPIVMAVADVPAGLLPWALWATTEKLYEVPLVSPAMVQLVAVVVVQVAPPGEAVTV